MAFVNTFKNFFYDIGDTLVIKSKTYIIKRKSFAFDSDIRCKYCPFRHTNCTRGLNEALNLPSGTHCQNIITIEGRMEPISARDAWKLECQNKKEIK